MRFVNSSILECITKTQHPKTFAFNFPQKKLPRILQIATNVKT